MLRVIILGLLLGRGGNDRARGWSARKRERKIRETVLSSLYRTYGQWRYDNENVRHINVTITRVSPGNTPLDSDNAVAACKRVRDSVAQWCGIDDGSNRYTWNTRCRHGPWSVEIEIDVELERQQQTAIASK